MRVNYQRHPCPYKLGTTSISIFNLFIFVWVVKDFFSGDYISINFPEACRRKDDIRFSVGAQIPGYLYINFNGGDVYQRRNSLR